MRRSRKFATWLLAGLAAGPAAAQFSQYTPPGTFEETPESLRKEIELAMGESRWRFGRFYVDPWAGLRELTYDDNVGARAEPGGAPDEQGTVSDYSATVGAGLRAYSPVGKGFVFTSHLLPEYVYWNELSERRRLNGRYGIGLFGAQGRVGLEASASRVQEARFFSQEFEDQVNVREDRLEVDLEVSVVGGFALRGLGRLTELSLQEDESNESFDPLRALDRRELVTRAGVRYHFPSGVLIGAGVEESEANFEELGEASLDNMGTSPYAELYYDGTRLFFLADLVARDLEFATSPELLDFDEPSGRVRAAFEVDPRLQPQVFANRNLVYSISDRWAYFEDNGYGAGVLSEVSDWLNLRVYGELGTNQYRPRFDPADQRDDDFSTVGVDLQFNIGPLILIVAGSRTEYDSTLALGTDPDEFDRTVNILRFGVVWGGRSPSPWT